jgi:hypothetical protein
MTLTADDDSLVGLAPESWLCIDCGFDTAPGLFNRAKLEKAFEADTQDQDVPQLINRKSEVYMVRNEVWAAAGMEPYGGCLCIGCLEKRLGRRLKPKEFDRDHPFNTSPGTTRLLKRRGAPYDPLSLLLRGIQSSGSRS